MTTTDDLAALLAAATKPTRYDGYEVDQSGNVWSTSNWRGYGRRKLSLFPNTHGYMTVKVKVPGGMKKMMVHREVCEAFHGPKPSPEYEVRHLNGDKTDNRACNVVWGTKSENALDRGRHGTCKAAANGRAALARIREGL